MQWWKEKKHVLVREKTKIDEQYPGNDFVFEVRNNSLWITGTLLNLFKFELKYPDSYPFALPHIYPEDRSSKCVPRHQYINTGRFCLDIREKTWSSHLTAADIIRSLEVLLIAEGIRKIKKDKKLIVYEEDEPTMLQKKFKTKLCLIPSDLEFPPDLSIGKFKYFYLMRPNTYRIVISALMHDEKDVKSSLVKKIWKTESISSISNGLWIRTSLDNISKILNITEFDKLNDFLVEKKIIAEGKNLKDTFKNTTHIHLLLFDENYPNAYFYVECNIEKNKNEPYGTYVIDLEKISNRIPNKDNYEVLKNRKVTIIGCGSGGSKVAEYLVKAGVHNFVLIDEDILTTENVARHACQLDDISIEKVYAVSNKLHKINPNINVKNIVKNLNTIDHHVNGLIKDSDVIIVATASNEELFNEYTYSRGIPSIYSKVYPFGFGGEVIRIIPNVTPCFECCHHQKEVLIEEQFKDSKFPESETISYDQLRDGRQIPIPSLAVDADFVALMTAKMALDILIEANYEIFKEVPNIRLWGNKKEWIFNQSYQCLSIENKNLKSFENCLVCYGDKVIEKELGKSTEQIEKEYDSILTKIKNNKS